MQDVDYVTLSDTSSLPSVNLFHIDGVKLVFLRNSSCFAGGW